MLSQALASGAETLLCLYLGVTLALSFYTSGGYTWNARLTGA